MKKIVAICALLGAVILASLALTAPVESRGPWYWVKCKRVKMGPGYRGRVAYCTKCQVIVSERRGRSPGPGWEAHKSQRSALEHLSIEDCPEGY